MKITEKEKKQINEMPKIILHLHLDGSLRPETVQKRLLKNSLNIEEIEEWFKEGKIFESDKNVLLQIAKLGQSINIKETTEKLSVDKECRDLNKYLEKFSLPCAVLQTPQEIEESTYELLEDLHSQNVIYAEVRFAPSKHTLKGLTQEEVVEAAIRGMEKAKEKFKINGNLILCCMRGDKEKDQEDNFETVDVAKKLLGKGVCAIDLAGAEAIFPTENFEQIFQKARELRIPFTIHAGEAAGEKSIRKALEFGASRIGHGVRSVEDERILKLLKEKEITLEICPISNLQTQAIKGEHPIEKLYRQGIKTTISTDNNTVSGTNILKEYEWIIENTNLKIEDIISMNIYAARSAFAKLPEIANLVGQINEYRVRGNNTKQL